MHDLSSHASYCFFIEISLVKKNISCQLKNEFLLSSVTKIIPVDLYNFTLPRKIILLY